MSVTLLCTIFYVYIWTCLSEINLYIHIHYYRCSRIVTEYTGGGDWFNGQHTVFLNVDCDALHFHSGSLKINIFKELFW